MGPIGNERCATCAHGRHFFIVAMSCGWCLIQRIARTRCVCHSVSKFGLSRCPFDKLHIIDKACGTSSLEPENSYTCRPHSSCGRVNPGMVTPIPAGMSQTKSTQTTWSRNPLYRLGDDVAKCPVRSSQNTRLRFWGLPLSHPDFSKSSSGQVSFVQDSLHPAWSLNPKPWSPSVAYSCGEPAPGFPFQSCTASWCRGLSLPFPQIVWYRARGLNR